MRTALPLVAALVALPLAVAACKTEPKEMAVPVLTRDSTQTLSVRGLSFDRDTKTLRGEVKNYREYPYDSVLVVLDVVSDDLRTLGSFRDSIATLPGDSTWTFSAVLSGVASPDSATHIKVTRYAGTARGQARSDVSPGALIPIPRLGR